MKSRNEVAVHWDIKRTVKKGDYLYAVVKNHPNATRNGYVLYHRVVMENSLGRMLGASEVVHHRNGNKHDNRIENLEVLSRSQHSIRHNKDKGRLFVRLRCPACKVIFVKAHNQIGDNRLWICCSRQCNGRLSRYSQLNEFSEDLLKAIEANIIEIFRQ